MKTLFWWWWWEEDSESSNEMLSLFILEFILEPSYPKPFSACICGSALTSLRHAVWHSSSVAVCSCFHHSLPVIMGGESDNLKAMPGGRTGFTFSLRTCLMCYFLFCLFFPTSLYILLHSSST